MAPVGFGKRFPDWPGPFLSLPMVRVRPVAYTPIGAFGQSPRTSIHPL
nr:MAG TPA: hypothetical protein [Caudoviricetes sp.]